MYYHDQMHQLTVLYCICGVFETAIPGWVLTKLVLTINVYEMVYACDLQECVQRAPLHCMIPLYPTVYYCRRSYCTVWPLEYVKPRFLELHDMFVYYAGSVSRVY